MKVNNHLIEKILTVFNSTSPPPMMKEAFLEWSKGNSDVMEKLFPGFNWYLKLDRKMILDILDLYFELQKDDIETTQSQIHQKLSDTVSFNLESQKQSQPFNIIAKRVEYKAIYLEFFDFQLLDESGHMIEDRKNCNKQCLAGAILKMIDNNFFKKTNPFKKGKNKKVTKADIIKWACTEFHQKTFQQLKGRGDSFIKLAEQRIPLIEKMDQKKVYTFK